MKLSFASVALLSACFFLGAEDSNLSGAQSNVILITIDTLRADYVGCYGSPYVQTPALDGLAADGVLFETAYCQVPLTPPSHASILTGRYPASHGLRDFTIGQYRKGIPSFARILKERGYQTAAFVSAFVLDESWGLSEGFDLYYDDFDLEQLQGTNPGNVQRRAEETIDRVLPWLGQVKPPFFLWVHLFDPHHDYDPPPPFDAKYSSNLYAGEVAYTDQQIGRLLEALDQADLYRDSLIIATSDHGESLGEHGENEHGFFLYEAVLRIPLIVKLPASYETKGHRSATIAQTIDVLPTTLQVLRVRQETGWGIEGRGLLSNMLGKRTETGFAYAETLYPQTSFGWSSLRAIREGDYKYIQAPTPELYDVVKDPQERSNLYVESQPLAHQLRSILLRLEQSFLPQDQTLPGTTDPERVERLGALGYVSVAQPVRIQEDGTLPDPKDQIHIFNQILKGLQAAEAGQFGQSNRILEEIAEKRPQIFIVHYSIGQNYLKMGKPEQALKQFEQAAELNPDFTSIHVGRGRALSQLGQYDEAIRLLEEVVEKHPTNLAALRLLAGVYTRQKNLPAAIKIYRALLSQRADDKMAIRSLGVALVEQREYEEGLARLAKAIELGLEDAQLRNSQGIALSNRGRLEEAVQSYRRALELKPDFALPRLNLAFSLLQAGKRNEALEEFGKLCQTSPELCRRYRSRFQ